MDLQQVQADKSKVQGGPFWMVLAMMVSTSLWLGGAFSQKTRQTPDPDPANQMRQIALCRTLLLAVDGLPHTVQALRKAFRSSCQEKASNGGPPLVAWPDIASVQVVKQRSNQRLTILHGLCRAVKQRFTSSCTTAKGGHPHNLL